jgi:hypothetical protein
MTYGNKHRIEIFLHAVAVSLRTRKQFVFSVASMFFVVWILLFANENRILGHGHFCFSSARIDGIVDLFTFLFPWIFPCILIAYGNLSLKVLGLSLCIPMLVIWFLLGLIVFDIDLHKISTDTAFDSELLEIQKIDSTTNKCIYRTGGGGAWSSFHIATCIEKKVLLGLLHVETIDYHRE